MAKDCDTFEIGVITGAHGVRGEVKILPFTGNKENLASQPYFLSEGEKLRLKSAKVHGKFLIAHFEGCGDREAAAEMRGTRLSILRENAAPLPEGEFYMKDLLGCSVYEDSRLVGELTDIYETGSNDVWEVRDDNGRELLVPALKGVVLKVDIEGRRIDVSLPEGLEEDDYI